MRRGATLVALLALGLLARPAGADTLFAPDKIAHFGTSAGAGIVVDTVEYHYVKRWGPVGRTLTSTAIATIPGLITEIIDSQTGHGFSVGDLGADALGALTGVVSSELFNGAFFVSASDRQIRIGWTWGGSGRARRGAAAAADAMARTASVR